MPSSIMVPIQLYIIYLNIKYHFIRKMIPYMLEYNNG